MIRKIVKQMVADKVRLPYGFMVTPDEFFYISEKSPELYTSKEIKVMKSLLQEQKVGEKV